MEQLAPYTDTQLRAELDRRKRAERNAKGFVRCEDCIKPEVCTFRFRDRLKPGVWRICKDYYSND